jgi:3-(3-hydroxy-phenyl)propionate hydroxylase
VSDIETDVLVVGAGPCGMALANLLGVYGTRALVIDRDVNPPDYPRAVGIDDESLRTCQAIGVVDEVLADTLQNTPIRYYTSWGRCFAHVKPADKPFGWPRRNLFLQPLLEKALRVGLTRFDQIETRFGCELTSLAQDATGVTAWIRQADGSTTEVRAAYLVGADGGRSTVRDLIDVKLDGSTASTKWLVVDVADDQLDAPYSAVYCSSDSPVLMVPLPYGHRRFEFRLGPHDDETAVVQDEHVRQLLGPRYGTTPLPRIVRARVYLHHSRVAHTFQVGRVFLAGDAAHLQAPFFGQGMNSGIRDATNLAWKLAAVTRGVAKPTMLDTYDIERRTHASAMVSFAHRIGQMYRPRNIVTERLRDVGFRVAHKLPGGKEYILQMKYKPMPRYTNGVVAGVDESRKTDPVGRMFMQPEVETPNGRMKFDDAVGDWFAVVGVGFDPYASLSEPDRQWWASIGARFVHVRPARSIPGPVVSATPGHDVTEVEDVDGAFRDWKLARPHEEIIVLRPDRYVAATCNRTSFAATTASLRATLG